MVAAPWTRLGSPAPVSVNDACVDPPMAENTVFRVFQSMYFGNDAGQVAQAGCVSYTRHQFLRRPETAAASAARR